MLHLYNPVIDLFEALFILQNVSFMLPLYTTVDAWTSVQMKLETDENVIQIQGPLHDTVCDVLRSEESTQLYTTHGKFEIAAWDKNIYQQVHVILFNYY